MIERVTVVQFRVNCRCGSGAGCFEVKVWANTAKFTDVIVARLRKCSDLIREGKVFVENKIKVASGVGCSERSVLYFTELLFKSNKNKFSFRRVESKKIGSGTILFCDRQTGGRTDEPTDILRQHSPRYA